MNTKSNRGQENNHEIDSLFEFSSEKKEIDHEARMIMFRFLSEVERIYSGQRGFKNMLAKSINKSKSFVTQLYNGDKIINLITLAKIQKKLEIKFKITAFPKEQFELISSPIEQMTTNVFVIDSAFPNAQENYSQGIKNYSQFVQITPKSELHEG